MGKIFTFFFLFSYVFILFGQTSQDSSLIAYYKFDGDAKDSGVYKNDGTPLAVTYARDRLGNDTTAFKFNGTSSYVTIPNSASLSSPDSQITQMAWVYMNGWSKTGSVFNPVIMKSNSGTNAFHYRLSISTSGLGVAFNNWNNGHTAPYNFLFYRWYMVAVTFAHDTLKYYVDGDLIATQPFTTALLPDDRPLEIGRDVPGVTEHFNGTIDEVRIYNRALSHEEISTLYDNYHKENHFARINIMPDSMMTDNNRGLAWEDYDDDGDIDLYMTRFNHENALFVNLGDGTFELDTLAFPRDEVAASNAAGWADIDNDGDLDLFVINWGAPNVLYTNDGNGFFTIMDTVFEALSRTSSDFDFGDYDLDGYLDIFVANRDQANELYHNNGDGTFTRIDTGAIATNNRSSISSKWIDYDDDGDPDMYVTNTYNENNFLYRNDGGGKFSRIDTLSITTEGQHGASSNWSDFDNDGDFDLYLSHANYGDNNYFYENLGNGDFVLLSDVPMTNDGKVSAAASWSDFDNDGDKDLAVANGGWYRAQENLLYLNNGNKEFEVVTKDTFVTESSQSEAVTMVDWDGDGLLELAIANRDRRSFFYENLTESGQNWIGLRFEGTISNRSAIGTLVRLKSTHDGKPSWQMSMVSGHNGRRANSGLLLHFGLGSASMIDSLVVKWPSGLEEVYTDISLINQNIKVTENGGITGLKHRNNSGAIISTFKLSQNFPNPFNPVTTIRYTVGRLETYDYTFQPPPQVNLSIYNSLGQKVATLVSERQFPGSYAVQWNGSNFASGIYYYQLKINDRGLDTRKMILLK